MKVLKTFLTMTHRKWFFKICSWYFHKKSFSYLRWSWQHNQNIFLKCLIWDEYNLNKGDNLINSFDVIKYSQKHSPNFRRKHYLQIFFLLLKEIEYLPSRILSSKELLQFLFFLRKLSQIFVLQLDELRPFWLLFLKFAFFFPLQIYHNLNVLLFYYFSLK